MILIRCGMNWRTTANNDRHKMRLSWEEPKVVALHRRGWRRCVAGPVRPRGCGTNQGQGSRSSNGSRLVATIQSIVHWPTRYPLRKNVIDNRSYLLLHPTDRQTDTGRNRHLVSADNNVAEIKRCFFSIRAAFTLDSRPNRCYHVEQSRACCYQAWSTCNL